MDNFIVSEINLSHLHFKRYFTLYRILGWQFCFFQQFVVLLYFLLPWVISNWEMCCYPYCFSNISLFSSCFKLFKLFSFVLSNWIMLYLIVFVFVFHVSGAWEVMTFCNLNRFGNISSIISSNIFSVDFRYFTYMNI